jgi:hypothetical protein
VRGSVRVPMFLESRGIFKILIQNPGLSWKIHLVLKSPGNLTIKYDLTCKWLPISCSSACRKYFIALKVTKNKCSGIRCLLHNKKAFENEVDREEISI